MDKRVRFGFKEKLSAVRSIKAGRASCLSIAKEMGTSANAVKRWWRLYKQHGSKGLVLRNGSYDGHFKQRVIGHMQKNGLSLTQTAALFGIPQPCTVGSWLSTYQRLGVAGLQTENRGRKKPQMTKRTNKKKKEASSDPKAAKMAALQKEVEYLRAENAFLKKFDALIQQEKAVKAQARRQKPSGN